MSKIKHELSEGNGSLCKGDFLMSLALGEKKLFEKEVVGLKELRINLSELVSKAINSFEEVISGNAKIGGKTASIIATSILDEILEAYKFNPVMSYDEATNQHEILLEEVGIYASGETKQAALLALFDLIIDNTLEFEENKELYMRIPDMKKKFPYFLRLRHCETYNDLIQVLNLDLSKILS